ncbi:SCO family protein [Rhodomicrobium sp. Az07]|uniref:SCO family protein n=1 Tax=Rhodomicrobium sp. Az07 TaxID=2839034 RepID=UPI001BEC8F4D|nr:SCO family protein [Rhodomicrobium sp. Az07]MBT3071604.1 SCO family protein [Rhodomicrobium sp. Az07]
MKRSSVIAMTLAFLGIAGAGLYAILALSNIGVTGTGPLIGGAFSLVDTNGKRVTDADFRGKLMLVFFGYTHCPDVCPTGLQQAADLLAKLGPDAADVVPVFISVDPARDTPPVMKSYVENFDPRIVGLTGDAADVASAAKAYRVYFRKAGSGDDYTIDHSAFVYLMGRNGDFISSFMFNAPVDMMVGELKKQLAAGASRDTTSGSTKS